MSASPQPSRRRRWRELLIPPSLGLAGAAFLLASMVFGVAGQVFLKLAAGDVVAGDLAAGGDHVAATGLTWVVAVASSVLTQPAIYVGVVLYGIGFCFWLLTLARAELMVAYPYTALNYILVLVPAVVLLHEDLAWQRLVGIVLIVIGVFMHALCLPRQPASSVSSDPSGGGES